jgi:hypothetical protein
MQTLGLEVASLTHSRNRWLGRDFRFESKLGPRTATELGPFITLRADIAQRRWHVRFVPILLQKSAATDWAIEPFVESRALKRWP